MTKIELHSVLRTNRISCLHEEWGAVWYTESECKAQRKALTLIFYRTARYKCAPLASNR